MKVPRPAVWAGRHAASCHGTERFLRCFRENDGHSWVSLSCFFSSGFTSLSWASSFVKTISEGSQIYLNIRLFKVFTIQRFLSLDANLDLAVASARRWPRL